MELVKISELPIKEITTIDAYVPIIDNVGEDIDNYRISLLNLFKTGGIINVNRTYGDANYTLQTALAVIEPTLLTNGVFITFRGMNGWELYQKDKYGDYFRYVNSVDDELETGSQNPLTNDAITRMYNELLSTINSIVIITNHKDLENKNAEADFQHVTQEEKTGFHTHNNKEYLDNYNPALFATALQGEKADSALQSLPSNTVIDADYPALKDKVNGIEENANNYIHPDKHPTSILEGIDTELGDENTFLNKKGEFTTPIPQVVTDGVTITGNGTTESKIALNILGLNEADNYFVTEFEKEQIEALSPIEFALKDVVNGIILLENPYKMYRLSVTEDMTVTMNTALVDLNKYIKFFLKININSNVVVTFPQNFYFANLAIPSEIGEYLYEVSTSDSGATWRAILRYKNIATVGIDTDGNQIVGAKIYYVDGTKLDNTGDGLSWATAKKDIQPAIDLANFGDAVFVKGAVGAGIKYLPTTERVSGNARTKAFIMKAGVNVYGGFRGIGSSIFERPYLRYEQEMKLPSETTVMYVDLPEYRSILSGEIAGDSVLVSPATARGNQFTSASIANNSYQVVVGDNMTLNGFEIIGGNANATGYINGGGIIGSNTTISQCYIYNNSANSGGGVHQANLINCIVSNNSTNTSTGGGLSNSYISNSIIHSNQSSGTQNTTATRCAIYNNYAGGSGNGGGVGVTSVANSCVIYNNFASVSGGGFAGTSATNCSIYNNTAGRTGGGTSGGTITNSLIYNNVGQVGNQTGGAAAVTNGTLTNCAIFNNSCIPSTVNQGVGGVGGATLINCTVIRNSTTSNTHSAGTDNCILRNTVVYGNRNGVGVKSNVTNTNSSEEIYSAFEDEVRAGTGNISLSLNNTGDANSPNFKSLSGTAGVIDVQFLSIPEIENGSFLIDKGDISLNNTGVGSQYDVLFKNRLVDTIDIGAYENQKII